MAVSNTGKENASLVLILLQNGADPNASPQYMSRAAENAFQQSVEHLLRARGKVDLSEQDNPMRRAIVAKHAQSDSNNRTYDSIIRIMIESPYGAIKCTTLEGALQSAIEKEDTQVAIWVMRRAIEDQSLQRASGVGCDRLDFAIEEYGGLLGERETRARLEYVYGQNRSSLLQQQERMILLQQERARLLQEEQQEGARLLRQQEGARLLRQQEGARLLQEEQQERARLLRQQEEARLLRQQEGARLLRQQEEERIAESIYQNYQNQLIRQRETQFKQFREQYKSNTVRRATEQQVKASSRVEKCADIVLQDFDVNVQQYMQENPDWLLLGVETRAGLVWTCYTFEQLQLSSMKSVDGLYKVPTSVGQYYVSPSDFVRIFKQNLRFPVLKPTTTLVSGIPVSVVSEWDKSNLFLN